MIQIIGDKGMFRVTQDNNRMSSYFPTFEKLDSSIMWLHLATKTVEKLNRKTPLLDVLLKSDHLPHLITIFHSNKSYRGVHECCDMLECSGYAVKRSKGNPVIHTKYFGDSLGTKINLIQAVLTGSRVTFPSDIMGLEAMTSWNEDLPMRYCEPQEWHQIPRRHLYQLDRVRRRGYDNAIATNHNVSIGGLPCHDIRSQAATAMIENQPYKVTTQALTMMLGYNVAMTKTDVRNSTPRRTAKTFYLAQMDYINLMI